MKKMISLLVLAMSVSTQVFATTSNVEKISALSAELTQLQLQLDEARYQQKADSIRVIMSFAAATFFAGYHVQNWNVGEKMANFEQVRAYMMKHKIASYAVATGLTAYGAASGYRVLRLKHKYIPEFQERIAAKQKELEAAKKVLENLE